MFKNKKIVISICIISMLVLSISGCSIRKEDVEINNPIEVVNEIEPTEEVLKEEVIEPVAIDSISVRFIDVGQADSCVIVTPNNEVILIDAGEDRDAEEIISELEDYEFEDIDLMILSHPHADHIGGAETIIDNYVVDEVLMCSYPATSKLFENLLDCLTDKSIKTTQATVGLSYSIDNVNIEVMAVDTNPKDNNNSSIVCKVSYGDIDMLFMGDSEIETEEVLLENDLDLDCEILKVGHHGSETSTCDDFLYAVSPSLAIISVGEGNKYNHPSEEVLLRFSDNSVNCYRTDKLGTIELEIDGINIVSNFIDSFETENTQSGNFLIEPAVAEVHLPPEEEIINKVIENK